MQADCKSRHTEHGRHGYRQTGPFQFGETIEKRPERMAAMLQVIQRQAFGLGLALRRALADASVGQQDRQQYQVGQDQYHDTNGRGNRQVLDYRDIDDH
ncbi:hypothetical protein D3C76_1041270 [compost metagenome]